jgi:hypothetical protein
MTDLETRLRDADLAEPPLGFDPDEVADRAARQGRRRIAVVAGTFVALAAVAAALLLAPRSTTAPPADVPTPPSLAEQARVRQALTDAVTRLFPVPRHLSVGRSPADSIGADRLSATVDLVDATGQVYTFQLTVRGASAARQVVPPERLCPAPGPTLVCTRFPQPGGGVLVVSELDHKDGSGVVVGQAFNGFLYRPDGSSVTVTAGVGPSLTRDQLTKVITDPAFTLS